MDIGQLALRLTVDPTSFEAGLLKAQGTATNFGRGVTGVSADVVKAFEAIEANPIGAVLVAAATAFAAFKAASGFATAELKELDAAGTAAGNAQAALSRKFGMSADAAGGLSLMTHKLGLDSGAVSEAMQHFERHVGDAANGNVEAARAFTRLGISAKDFTRLPMEEQLSKLGGALQEIHNPTERMSAAYAVLGKRGQALLPVIQQGGAAFAEAAAQSQRWGLTFSAADAEAIRSATVAQRGAEAAVGSIRQGFANGVASAFAPLRQAWADAITAAVEYVEPFLGLLRDGIGGAGGFIKDVIAGVKQGFADWAGPLMVVRIEIMRAWEALSKTLGLTGDWHDTVAVVGRVIGWVIVGGIMAAAGYVELLLKWWNFWAPVIKFAGGVIVETVLLPLNAVAAIVTGILDTLALLPSKLGGDAFKRMAQDAREAQYVMNHLGDSIVDALRVARPDFTGGGGDFGDAVETNHLLAAAIEEATQKAQAQADTFGMGEGALKRYEFAQQGATKAMLDGLKAAQDQLEANKMLANLKSPFEKFGDEVERLNELLQEDLLTVDQYDVMISRELDKIPKDAASKDAASLAPEALAAGSKEALEAVRRTLHGEQKADPMKRLEDIQKEALAKQERQRRDGEDIRNAIQSGKVFKVFNF